MTEQNEHLKHIKKELHEIEDGLGVYLRQKYQSVEERVESPLFSLEKRVELLLEYVGQLSIVVPTGPVGLVRLCCDCGEEEANPGLPRCGPCYSERIGRR